MFKRRRARGWLLVVAGGTLIASQLFETFPLGLVLLIGAALAIGGGAMIADNPERA